MHRCYQMTTDPAARSVMALRKITGVEMTKMLPTPNIDDSNILEACKWAGDRKLYTFAETDYGDMSGIWSGNADWADNQPLEAVIGVPEFAAEGSCHW